MTQNKQKESAEQERLFKEWKELESLVIYHLFKEGRAIVQNDVRTFISAEDHKKWSLEFQKNYVELKKKIIMLYAETSSYVYRIVTNRPPQK